MSGPRPAPHRPRPRLMFAGQSSGLGLRDAAHYDAHSYAALGERCADALSYAMRGLLALGDVA